MNLAAGVAPVRRRHEIPPAIAARMGEPDYADLFVLTTPDAACWRPEEWARAICVDAAGGSGQFVWRGLLGLRLAPGDPTRIAGWKIDARGDDWIRLAASGRRMDGLLVVHVDDGELSLGTAVRFHGPLGRWVWARLSSTHRRLAPGLLREAHGIIAAGGRDHTP